MKNTPRAGAALSLLTAAAPASSADKVPNVVGITVGTLGNPFFIPLVAGAKAAGMDVNPKASVTVVGADSYLGKQSTQIDSFIAAGANLFIVNAVDVNAIGAELAAKKRGRNEMIFAGVDGSANMTATLKQPDSRIVASTSQDSYDMAKQAAGLAIGTRQGKTPPQAVTLLDTKLVAEDNAATFKGWDGPY